MSDILIDSACDLLRALGIVAATFALDGGGDSGESTLATVRYADGREDYRLPELPIALHNDGRPILLGGFLEDYSSDLPDGDWVNNEGGYGTVTIRPLETDPHERVECDMTYRADDDYDDDDYDEDDDPDDPDDPDEPDAMLDAFEIAGTAADDSPDLLPDIAPFEKTAFEEAGA
ncbi:hypothetical protein PX554_20085 [Sphingomonas sp. H39-1-10]|uniref:hypothetical protein n=1 Tax=Sphingomonas pollutisoli TaxID=3030829 RepID=UPI0023B90EA2|nr:hypothetical protein [Sphingomonas pollutisoli]MDF0490433.1 hypothetical protein [Sphingomonas pollutisoli]